MTTTFLLVRHAAHDNLGSYLAGRRTGISLGPAGRAQAERLAQRLSRERFDKIVSSPRERTCETATIIAEINDKTEVETYAEPDEVDFGEWSGKTFDELNSDPNWVNWNSNRGRARTPGGEGMIDVQRRVLACLESLMLTHPGGTHVVVSHAEVIRAAICHFLGMPLSEWYRFEISPASISRVAMGDWGAKVLGLNEVID